MNYKQEASVSILFASMHACACEQYAQVSVSNRVVKRFYTLAGSCEQCRRGVRFHPGPTGIVLCLPVWLWDRTGHLASWVPKARMTDTHVPLTTYPYRSLDSIYSMTLLALTHTVTPTQNMHPTHTCTHSTSYFHTQIGEGLRKEEERERERKKEQKMREIREGGRQRWGMRAKE